MRVLIRTDSSRDIGTGHVMRCLVFAKRLRERGARVEFICRTKSGDITSRIHECGFNLHTFSIDEHSGTSESAMLAQPYLRLISEWERDAEEVLRVIQRTSPHWLIIDHHHIDSCWETLVRKNSSVKMLAIDGQADRPHSVDALLDPTVNTVDGKRWGCLLPHDCRVFSGLGYAPIRSEFYFERSKGLSDRTMKRIIVLFGGVDLDNATAQIVRAIDQLQLDTPIDIVAGYANPHINALRHEFGDTTLLRVLVNPKNLAGLMRNASFAISAGGTTLIEQLLLGLPSIVITTAKNQVQICQDLAALGMISYIGSFQEDNRNLLIEKLTFEVQRHIKNPGHLRVLSEKIWGFMDPTNSANLDTVINHLYEAI